AALRRTSAEGLTERSAVIDHLTAPKCMASALAGVNAIVLSSAIGADVSGVPEDDYRVLNSEATARLARAAQQARVGRFVFLSSIRAQSGPTADVVLTEQMKPRPTDAYGRSKLEAERALAD